MQKTKTAMITLCGRPNVGKSSLTNALVGEKIAIVSNKPQTTRNRIYGVVTEGDTQLVLLDTPGFHKPRSRLGDYMVKVARDSIADVDLVALLVEPVPHVGIPEQELIEKIRQSSLPAVLCINKIDTVPKTAVLVAMETYRKEMDFAEIVPVSALRSNNTDTLLDCIFKYLPYGKPFYDEDTITDQPQRQIVAEMIREMGEERATGKEEQ